MNEITQERRREILESLGSTTCEACGGPKKPKMSHCRSDYFKLPPNMRSDLYQGFGEGYEEAYEASLEFLKSSPRTAQPVRPQATCRSCPAPIIFAQQNPTEKNPHPSNNPLNARPHPEGNLRLDLQTLRYDVLTGEELTTARAAGEQLYLSHFVNCPNRGQHRKGAQSSARR